MCATSRPNRVPRKSPFKLEMHSFQSMLRSLLSFVRIALVTNFVTASAYFGIVATSTALKYIRCKAIGALAEKKLSK